MADNNIWDIEESRDLDESEIETDLAEEEYDEASGSILSSYIDSYCDNLVNPDPEKCIAPKKLYITLGAAAAGAVLVFLFIGWLLCYCPLNTTGFSAEDFIREYNSIVSESDVNQVIENNLATVAATVSGTDLNVNYPDFSDLTIPENADLEEGVLLCGGDIIVKAELKGGNIQTLDVSVAEGCDKYDFENGYFNVDESVHADYSKFQHYASVGKARLAFYNLICESKGEPTEQFVLNDAVNYGVIMENFVYYVYSVYGTFDPTIVYYEDSETCTLEFDPSCFNFHADTIQKTIVQPDNGIYRFFDGIFGEKPEEEIVEEPVSDSSADNLTVEEPVSAADAASSADAQ